MCGATTPLYVFVVCCFSKQWIRLHSVVLR